MYQKVYVTGPTVAVVVETVVVVIVVVGIVVLVRVFFCPITVVFVDGYLCLDVYVSIAPLVNI